MGNLIFEMYRRAAMGNGNLGTPAPPEVYTGQLIVQVTGGILQSSILYGTLNGLLLDPSGTQQDVTWSGTTTTYGAYTYDLDLVFESGRWKLNVVMREIVGGEGNVYRGNTYYNDNPNPWSGTWTNTSGTGDIPTVTME